MSRARRFLFESGHVWRRVASIVAALAVVVFLPSLLCGFVFDDIPLISENHYAQRWEFLSARLAPICGTCTRRARQPIRAAITDQSSRSATWSTG